jgi:hypothetical protein
MSVDLIVALITLLGTLIVLIWNVIDRSRSSFEERMSQATEFLTGQTQRRSAGIAIISGSSRRLVRRRETSWRIAMILLLCAQAIYLLEQSDQGSRPDEILNLRRILELLLGFGFQSAEQAEITMLAQRVKIDLEGANKSSKGFNRDEVRMMAAQSLAINEWVKPAKSPGQDKY